MTYYNDSDPFACAWLRELMAEGLIPKGDVDERSICDVTPGDVSRYDQCHFFAGIGGWSLALELAGYKNLRCWTGSCPCPSFSSAGKGRWALRTLVRLWRNFTASSGSAALQSSLESRLKQQLGYGWLDLVSADLEANGYVRWGGGTACCVRRRTARRAQALVGRRAGRCPWRTTRGAAGRCGCPRTGRSWRAVRPPRRATGRARKDGQKRTRTSTFPPWR